MRPVLAVTLAIVLPAATVALLLLTLILDPAAAAPREVRAARTDRAPVIDGRIEPGLWSQAPEIAGLQQQRPDNGEAATESTQVWILFDDDALYVAARLHARNVVTRVVARRDTYVECDWFGLLLDPLHDRRSGCEFFVNPDGVQYDAVISNDTQEDTSWDAVWQSAVSVDAGGWSAEMRIPLSQLRFVEHPRQVWGINFIRWIRHRQEQARLVTHPRNLPGYASRFGDLAGLDGIRPRAKVELTPYLTSGVASLETVQPADPLNDRTQHSFAGGGDLRWTGRSSLTANATIRPDFGQVEVDPAVLNLSQFELFFPEKRPFFLDGAKLYAFGDLATTYASPFRLAHPLLFYSRRIGRVPQGNARVSGQWADLPDETTIEGAGKLVFRTTGGSSIGLLDAVAGDEHARIVTSGVERERVVEPLTNYFAGRWTRDLGERSRLGTLVTGVWRRPEDATGFLPDRAVVAGADAYAWLGDRNVLLDGYLVGSHARGTTDAIASLQRSPAHQYQRPDADHLAFDPSRTALSGAGGRLTVSREKGTWRWQVHGESHSPGLDMNDLGFMARGDVQAAHVVGTWFDVATRRHTRSNRVSIGRYGTWTQGGEVLGDGIAGDVSTTFTNYWTATLVASRGFAALDDREARGGPAIRRPPGWSAQARIASEPRRPIAGELSHLAARDDDGGRQSDSRATLTLRPRPNLSFSITGRFGDNRYDARWVASVPDTTASATGGSRVVLGELAERRIEIAPRIDWTVRPQLTLQLYLQPFIASGAYAGIKELVAPGGGYRVYGADGSTIARVGSPRGYQVDLDGAGPAAPFTIRDPDFVLRSLRGNAVVRWEVNGATTLFLVWNQTRSRNAAETRAVTADDLGSIRNVAADDHLLLKVSHRFDLPR